MGVQERTEVAYLEEVEERFRQAMREPLSRATKMGKADIVVGVPFYDGADTIASVFNTVRKGLKKFYPDQTCVTVAVGSPAGGKALEAINSLPGSREISQIAFLLNDKRLNGRGWSVRAIMEIARILGAELAIVEADLGSRDRNGELEGLAPDWIGILLEPIKRHEMDLVVSRFNRHYFESPISTQLVYPLLTAIYNCPIHDLVGGQWGISHRLLRTYLQGLRQLWSSALTGYGIDCWLATKAITSGAKICEANLGLKIRGSSTAETEPVLHQITSALFDQVVADKEWWKEARVAGELPLLNPVATFGVRKAHKPSEVQISAQRLVAKYKRGFNQFHTLYKRILPQETYRQLETLARTEAKQFEFPAGLWAQTVYYFLLDLGARKEFAKGDLINSFVPLYDGREAGFTLQIQTLKAKLESSIPHEAQHLASLEAEQQIEKLVDEFLQQKPNFIAAWKTREEALMPPAPKVTYHESIPGVPLVVPLELASPDGKVVTAQGIYDSVFQRHKKEFEQFVYERLKTPRDAEPREIASQIGNFMWQVEKEIDKSLLPGDAYTVNGMRRIVQAIFRLFLRQETFALLPDMTSWLLVHYPPSNLLTKLGYSNIEALLREYEPNDVLALANWSEEQEYMERVWKSVRESVRPDHFGPCLVSPLVVSYEEFPSLLEMRESSLNKITARVVVSNLHTGMGGEFPKLRYLTTIAKNIIEAERFGKVWRRFAEEGRDFGEKVINSLEGHWGRTALSAHNIFENGHQRVLVERLRELAQRIAREAGKNRDCLTLAEHLNSVAASYHLALTLPDGTFIPCSAWTWASYSFKGGTGVPSPLSLHVERDWSSREFFTEYFKAAGGDEAAIEEKITELMEEGREWEDLTPILLGGVEEAKEIVPKRTVVPEYPPAGDLIRYAGNPILESIKEHPWESMCVLNPGVIRLNNKVYLIYRAVGEDNVSRFGLAISEDGFKFTERLDTPIFEPRGKSEGKGCEDARLTLIGDRIYMVYTAYDGLVAQIALASIRVDDFLTYRWGKWRRHGLAFPEFTDKDGTLFPERFDRRFAMLHRVEPHIWITFSRHLHCPWPRAEHRIVTGSMSGMVWYGMGKRSVPVLNRSKPSMVGCSLLTVLITPMSTDWELCCLIWLTQQFSSTVHRISFLNPGRLVKWERQASVGCTMWFSPAGQ